jgi:hypothetical protein
MRKMHLVVGGRGLATKYACGNKGMMAFGGNFADFSSVQPEARCEKCAASKTAKFYAKQAAKALPVVPVASVVAQDESIEIVAIEETIEQIVERDMATCKQELYKRKINARKLSQDHNNTIINEVTKDNKMEFTKEQDKAINALQAVENSPAWNRVSAYVIIRPMATFNLGDTNYKQWGKLRVLFPTHGIGSGAVKVFAGLQHDLEYVTGYDLDACLAQLDFWGTKVSNNGNWRNELQDVGFTVIQAI